MKTRQDRSKEQRASLLLLRPSVLRFDGRHIQATLLGEVFAFDELEDFVDEAGV